MLLGDGEGLGLDEVVKLITINELEGVLTVYRAEGAERLYFRGGRVLFSRQGRPESCADRFTALLSACRLPYRFCPGPLPRRMRGRDALALDPNALLMETARRRDEATRRVPRPHEPGAAPHAELEPRRDLMHPTLQGELDGIGLPALLQALHERGRTGMLGIARGEERVLLYLRQGLAFARASGSGRDDASLRDLLGVAGAGAEELTGEELEQERAALSARLLDATLWEGARFAFFSRLLPRKLHAGAPAPEFVTLRVERLLLEAAQLTEEWEALRRVLGPRESVYRFLSPTLKLQAVRTQPLPELSTLIDGRRGLDDLARGACVPRLEAARHLARLLREGFIGRARPNEEEARAWLRRQALVACG